MVQEGTEERRRGYTRSISQLKAYTRCGEAFNLERIQRESVPRRPAAWTILGVALHDTVMEWEKADRKIDPWEYFRMAYDIIVDEEWEKQPDPDLWFLPPNTKSVTTSIKNYRQRGLDQLDKYIPRCLSAPWEISCLEREFEITLGMVTVRGGVDRILFYPTTEFYVVEDIKTGSLKGEEDIRQLAFYAFVARELWDIPVNDGRYWFTKMDRGSDVTDLSRFDKNFWTREFRRLDRGINEEIFLAHPGDACGICPVKPWCNTMGWLKIGEPLK